MLVRNLGLITLSIQEQTIELAISQACNSVVSSPSFGVGLVMVPSMKPNLFLDLKEAQTAFSHKS